MSRARDNANLSPTIPDARMPNLTGAITTVEGAVATTIANDAVDSQHYAAGSIDNEHLADDAVGTDELANDVVINTSGAITTTGAFTSVGIDDNASGATAITIDSSENVGIGTNAPDTKLHIKLDDEASSSGLKFESADGTGEAIIRINNVGDIIVQADDGGTGTTERMRINGDDGNVGIGKPSPASKLDVAGAITFAGVLGKSGTVPSAGTTPNANFQVKGHTLAHFYYVSANPASASTAEIFRMAMHNTSGSSGAALVKIAGANVWIGQSLHNFAAEFMCTSNTSGNVSNTSLHSTGDLSIVHGNLGSNTIQFLMPTNTSYQNIAYIAVQCIGHHTFTPTMSISS